MCNDRNKEKPNTGQKKPTLPHNFFGVVNIKWFANRIYITVYIEKSEEKSLAIDFFQIFPACVT
jgi:hypothetical protein